MENPNDSEKWLGYAFAMLGLGLAVGPVLGSFVYDLIGYLNTFYFFTAYIVVTGMIGLSFLPSRMNIKSTESTSNELKVSYYKMLTDRDSVGALLIIVSTFTTNIYLDPILSVHLISIGMSPRYTGLAFACIGISCAIGSPLAGFLC